MKKELIVQLHQRFEERVHKDGEQEFWLARELEADHFAAFGKMVELGCKSTIATSSAARAEFVAMR